MPKQDYTNADRNLPKNVKRADVCVWLGDDGPWFTSCGVTWEFIEGGPADNGAYFCHHCGGVLLVDTDEPPASKQTIPPPE